VQKLVRLLCRRARSATAHFDEPFREFQYKLRATHYPNQLGGADDEFARPAHRHQFLLLAPNEVPGLSIRTQR
jgi:hypothetical protein